MIAKAVGDGSQFGLKATSSVALVHNGCHAQSRPMGIEAISCSGTARSLLYDKSVSDPAAAEMQYIDYGVSVLTRDVITSMIVPGKIADLAPLLNQLSIAGRLKGYEVFERFYEIGSPQGLDDFEARSTMPSSPRFRKFCWAPLP
jgi:hypothetical protein